jgi:hypothetical protein
VPCTGVTPVVGSVAGSVAGSVVGSVVGPVVVGGPALTGRAGVG